TSSSASNRAPRARIRPPPRRWKTAARHVFPRPLPILGEGGVGGGCGPRPWGVAAGLLRPPGPALARPAPAPRAAGRVLLSSRDLAPGHPGGVTGQGRQEAVMKVQIKAKDYKVSP